MKKHLKSIKSIKKQEKDINNIIPDIVFLSSILKKDSFIEKIHEELLSINEISSFLKMLCHLLFLFITFPVWFISEIFNFKYDQKFFSRIFISNYIYNEKVRKNQEEIFKKYDKEINKYNEILNKENFFSNLVKYEYNISKEEFDVLLIKNEVILEMDNKLKELYLSFEDNPEKFTEYFNTYVNAKREINEDLNFITKALNEHIIKNSVERNKNKEENKLHKAEIIDFNKYQK
tara:strand:- start:19671 stop:20369 length:699 start_codon:yes stop_codon:yes gene_type:complete